MTRWLLWWLLLSRSDRLACLLILTVLFWSGVLAGLLVSGWIARRARRRPPC